MSQNTLLPDDPKLTAYALGELEGDKRAAVEAALSHDPRARAIVEEIRATAAQLTTALAEETLAETQLAPVGENQRAAILPGRNPRVLDGGEFQHWRKKSLISFPRFYYIAGLGAAACFAVFVAFRTPVPHPPRATKTYTEIDLTKFPTGAELLGEANAAPAVTMAVAPAVPPKEEPATLLGEIKNERLANVPATDATTSSRLPRVVSPPLPLLAQANEEQERKAVAVPARAMTRPAVPAISEESTTSLPHFTVSASRDQGYSAGSRLAGARLNTKLQEIGSSIAVSNSQQPGPSFAYAGAAGSTRQAEAERLRRWQEEIQRRRDQRAGGQSVASAEVYAQVEDNGFLQALQNPLSTFAIDVDTAGYANVRRFLQQGTLPPRDAVRIEELVNYFPYRYPAPTDDAPFSASLEVANAPWTPAHRLVRIALKGREVATADRAPANLVFLLDVSGSMDTSNRLPLVKESMRLLLDRLRSDDRIAIVTYAGSSSLTLPSTPVARKAEISAALDSLVARGSTNGGMGIHLAYDIAKANVVEGGINRVILCTDGDFNVGVTGPAELTRLVEQKAKSGVFLTVFGFGMGNLKDATLESLADHGNGSYGYIDTRREAEKLLVEQVSGTLVTIAQDVKIQVEFNPAKVASYRLIGYENRLLKKEDFNDDRVDAGEIGAGHTVTALYEIVPVGIAGNTADGDGASRTVDELKYQRVATTSSRPVVAVAAGQSGATAGELLTVKVRYKKPNDPASRRLEFPLVDHGENFSDASGDFKFAAAVASFGMILRDSVHKGTSTINHVISWAGPVNDDNDPRGYRSEFIGLVNTARSLLR